MCPMHKGVFTNFPLDIRHTVCFDQDRLLSKIAWCPHVEAKSTMYDRLHIASKSFEMRLRGMESHMS